MTPIPTRIRIEYTPTTCIGNQACVKADPHTFRFDLATRSAILAGGVAKGNVVSLEKRGDANQIQRAISAAAACPVNAFRVVDADTGSVLVGNKIEVSHAKVIQAKYDDAKDFVLDPAGYFLFRVNYETKTIEAGFCNSKNVVVLTVAGKKPIDIYYTLAKQPELKLRPEHFAYVGRELEKAYYCLMAGLEYVQDDELHAMKPRKK